MVSEAQAETADIRAIPLCIICAKAEEMGKVARAFRLGPPDWFPNSRVVGYDASNGVYIGRFRADIGGEISYFITCCSRQGVQTFGIEAADLFTVVKPNLGDVIFGQCALNYEEGKIFVSEDGVANFDADALPLSPTAAENVRLASFLTESDQARYKYGAFASGCAVRLDAQEILDRVAEHIKRDVLALEMEASAFIQACNHTNVKSLGIIKGVSDLGNYAKGTSEDTLWYQAVGNAAEAVNPWVTTNIRFDQPSQGV
ncbi:hypothetical protein LTR49_027199 [Elasticomyces elasticus]|nr:hypothetical protein LTR49_027199 [Elasticomyces elasticus]